MNRNYLDGLVGLAGSAAILHGLARGNLNEAVIAGASMMLYEAGQLGLELYRWNRDKQYMSMMLRNGIHPVQIARTFSKLP